MPSGIRSPWAAIRSSPISTICAVVSVAPVFGIQQRGLVDQVAPLLERRAHRELHDVEERAVQREASAAATPRPRAAAALRRDRRRHLDARVVGQALDAAVVADVACRPRVGAGLDRAHDLRRELVVELHLEFLAGVERALGLGELRQVLVAPAEVLVDLAPELLDLVVVMQEPGHVLAGMLAGLGGEVAEPAEQLDAHPPPQALRVGLDDLAQPRVQVLAGATVFERVDEALVVEAGRDEADVGLGHAHGLGEEGVRVADASGTRRSRVRRAATTPPRCPTAPSPSGWCS